MFNAIHNHLKINICEDAKDAIEKGFDYNKGDTKPIKIKNVVIVKNGTVGENTTVDFVLEDENGQQFVFMLTGNLLKSIPC